MSEQAREKVVRALTKGQSSLGGIAAFTGLNETEIAPILIKLRSDGVIAVSDSLVAQARRALGRHT